MRMRTVRPRLMLLTTLLAAGGCRMIDQRTFEPPPQLPSQAALALPVLPAAPAARLRPADPGSGWRAALDAAAAHNPAAHFDLMTPIPTAESRAVQDRFARDGVADAETVAAALRADGVAAARITLGYVGDPGKPAREVRLYLH